jgi:AcrR family transcriptional regulator
MKQKRSQERRERILMAATRLFGKQGIDQTSLTDIAARADVPLPSIYDYFGDKQDLVLAVPEQNFSTLYDRASAGLAENADDPVAQLRAIYLCNFEYITENPGWGRVFFLEIWPSVIAAEDRIRDAVDRYAKLYVDLVRRSIDAGAYHRDLDPYLAMSLLMGGLCHLTAVWLLYGQRYDLVAKGEALFDMLQTSFIARPPV